MPQLKAEDFTGFCMAIGYIAQNWAMLEQTLDAWIAMIYHDIGGRKRVDPKLPRNFLGKTRFLRKAFNALEPLKPFAKEVIPILDKANNMSPKRNDLIHGVLTSMTPINGEWQMLILDLDSPEDEKHWHVARKFTFSPASFQALEAKLVPLAVESAQMGLRLSKSILNPLRSGPILDRGDR